MSNRGSLNINPGFLIRAETLYAPLQQAVREFVNKYKLEFPDYYKWYQGGPNILFGKDTITLGFKGIRRQISLIFNPDRNTLLISVTAYQDKYHEPVGEIPIIIERKLKDIGIIEFVLPVSPQKFLHYLDIAWRVVSSIEEGELLSEKDWKISIDEQAKIFGLK